MRIQLLVCFLLSCTSLPQAQRWHTSATNQLSQQAPLPLEDMAHMSWVRRDGAPSDITALAQTKDGYLWIGSRLGLFRFDGIQFSTYPFTSADPQLPSSDIAALAADAEGGLWIGYRMGGITYLRGDRKVDYDKRSGLVSESTEQLLCREDGSVWATADGRLMHLAGNDWENYSVKHGLSSQGLYTMFFDRYGNLWTAEKDHVYELKKGEETFVPIAIPSHAVNQFGQTPDGTVWIVDAWHDVRPVTDIKGIQAERVPGVPLLLVDDVGSLWLAQDFGGLTRIKPSEKSGRKVETYSTANGLTDGVTRAILKDKQGTIWVGTARGLDRFRSSPLVQFHGVRIDYHPALIADKNSGIWIDDMDKPLMSLKDGRLSFLGKPHGSSSLYEDADGAVWLHDPITHNFFRYTANSATPTSSIPVPDIAKEVENWCLGQDSQGGLLACFEGHGLWRYSGTRDSKTWEQVKAPGLPTESPIALVTGSGGRVWLGYPHNQIVLDDGNTFHIYGGSDGLELNSVITFYNADGLALAGGSDGLAYFDGRIFHSLRLRTSGLMRGISGIVKDRFGDLWLNAGPGVIRLPEKEWKAAMQDPQYAMDFQFLNEQDGLFGSPAQSKPAPSAVVDTAGTLWFATSGHIVSIDPAAVRKEQPPPNVLLQAVRVNGSAIPYNDGTPVSVDSRRFKSLEFDYIGVDLKSPDRVVYQYMLEGQDKDWQEAGDSRQAHYTNLAPRNYRFRVRAASGTGPWSELTSALPFAITPAFYQTKWFLLLCLAGVIVMIWTAYQLRVHQIAMRMDSQFEARLAERTRIAQELHDTLLQGVLSASMQLHVANDQLGDDSPAKPLVRRVLELMGGVVSDGRNAVRGLRISNEGAQDLGRAFARIPQELALEDRAEFRIVVVGTSRDLRAIVRDEVYRIGREAVTNAFRHSGAKTIEFELEYAIDELRVAVRDDGCGINPQVLQRGRSGHWGLQGMRERAEKIDALLKVWSRTTGGTEIDLRVPARVAFEFRAPSSMSAWLSKMYVGKKSSVQSELGKRAG